MAGNLTELFGDKPAEPIASPTVIEPSPAPTAPVAATPVSEPAKSEAPKPEPGFVPIAAVLDEREKRQKLETELNTLRAQHQTPSVPVEPEQLAAYLNEQTQRALTSGRFDVSETLATQTHGADTVQSAMDWGLKRSEESPAFAAEYLKQKHPIDWAVRQHKREQLVLQIGDDADAWVRKRYAELGSTPAVPLAAQAPAAPQPIATPKPAAPSPSLVSAPSAGGPMTQVRQPHPALERLFGKET